MLTPKELFWLCICVAYPLIILLYALTVSS